MLACAEEVLKRLELHYRVMTCHWRHGFASQKTTTSRSAARQKCTEISSCSVWRISRPAAWRRYRTRTFDKGSGRQSPRHTPTAPGVGWPALIP